MAANVVYAQNKTDNKDVTILNRSRQSLPIQVKPPNGDFFIEERQVRLNPGKSITLPKKYLNWAQIENCRGRGDLVVVER